VHQLHCLYNLYRATNFDYYEQEARFARLHPQVWHNRVDHCLDILRQKLEWYVELWDKPVLVRNSLILVLVTGILHSLHSNGRTRRTPFQISMFIMNVEVAIRF
jgi:Mycotoxin biosynthesis protein UstYa